MGRRYKPVLNGINNPDYYARKRNEVERTVIALKKLGRKGLAREISALTNIPWQTQLAVLRRMQKEGLVNAKTVDIQPGGVNVYFLVKALN